MKLSRLFKRKASATTAAPAPAPMPPCCPKVPVYVIGDVHGRLDLLDALWAKLDADTAVVTVGDYVDRGEESAQVLRRLMALSTAEPNRITCLMGNHEAMMLEFIDTPVDAGNRWLTHGGLQTVASFGVTGVKEKLSDDERTDVAARLRDAMGDELLAWLRARPTRWSSGNLWVVHAGADPTRPVADQSDDRLIWGHPAFLTAQRTDGQWVAHGHTVVAQPEQRAGRIAVDTGAYHSGRLTAAKCLTDGEVLFVQSFTKK